MKKHEILRTLALLILIPVVAFTAADRTLKTEIITSDKSNQDITITPTGTGDVVLKAYTGFLNWASGSPTEITSVDSTEFQYLDGVTSAIQTQVDSKQADVITTQGDLIIGDGAGSASRLGIGAANYVLQSSGTTASWIDGSTFFVDLTSAQTVGGVKTFSTDTLWSSSGAITIPSGTTAQRPGTPTAAMFRFNETNSNFEGYDGSAWGEIGGGSAGGINYNDNYDLEANADGYSAFDDVSAYIDGTGGTPNITVARNTTTPLRGLGDLLVTIPSATNVQYEGFSFDVSVDNADKAKIIVVDFDYDLSDVECVDDYWQIRIYDKTNTNIIRGNGEGLKCGTGHHYFTFQTAPDSTEYRVSLFYNDATTLSTSYESYFDNIKVGPQVINHGAIVTDWVDFTPTGTWTTNTTYTGRWRRVGDTMEVESSVVLGGAPDATALTVNIPSGYSIDTAKLNSNADSNFALGIVNVNDTGSTDYPGVVRYSTSTVIQPVVENVATYVKVAAITNLIPHTFASGDEIVMNYKIPIAGWSSQSKMSTDLGSRQVVVEGAGNGGTSITANVTDIDFTETRDTTSSWNGTQFTAPETGDYDISGSVFVTVAGAFGMYAYIDTVQSKILGENDGTNAATHFSGSIKLTKGQVLSFRSSATKTLSNSTVLHWIHIAKKSDPQTMLENEKVVVIAKDDSAQSATSAPLTWNTELTDTNNAFTSGVFTCPVTGTYHVDASVLTNSVAWTAGTGFTLTIQLNGTNVRSAITRAQTSASFLLRASISADVDCNQGETIEVDSASAATVNLYSASSDYNFINIHRIK